MVQAGLAAIVSFVRDHVVLVLLIGLILVGMGWLGGGVVGFVAGTAVGWIVSLVVDIPVSIFGFALMGSFLGGVIGIVALPASAFYVYRRRSN